MNMSEYKAENLKNDISEKLQFLRSRKGLSQKEAAKGIGISFTALSYYETGARVPNVETLYLICRYYDCSLDYLIGLSPNMTPNRNFNDVEQAEDLGFIPETIDFLYENNYLVKFMNDSVNHSDLEILSQMIHKTYHSDVLKNDYLRRLCADLIYVFVSEITGLDDVHSGGYNSWANVTLDLCKRAIEEL